MLLSFADLAALPDPPLDALALALAAEFREVDAGAALQALDALGAEVAEAAAGAPTAAAEARACAQVLGARHGFTGDVEEYDHPDNSMLDVVLERRRGLPILLSVLYVTVARRAGIRLAGVGLPGHFVVAHLGTDPPVLLDPFRGGAALAASTTVRAWHPHETAVRMLSNLVLAHERRGDLGRALHAARLRLALPMESTLREGLETELRALGARLN